MKILTNKAINSFVLQLRNKNIPPKEVVFRLRAAISFVTWLSVSKKISESDAIRFRSELYKAKHELTYQKAFFDSFPLKYVGISLTLILFLLMGISIYHRIYKNVRMPLAYSTAPLRASRTISFQGRLTDIIGNPITTPIDITYTFYTEPTGGSPITGSTRVCTVNPDQDGAFNSLIGNDEGGSSSEGTLCAVEIPSTVFTENPHVYLGVKIAAESIEMSPRQQIANVGYAINSETLQGISPGQGLTNIPYINQSGDMLIAAANPGLRSISSSNFTISSARATTIQSAGGGDITLSATDGGSLRFKTYNGPGSTLERMTILPTTGYVGIGTTAPTSMLSVGASSQFQVNPMGDIIKLNNVATSFPTVQGAINSFLKNDGSGGLTWADPTSTGIAGFWQRNGTSVAPTTIGDNVGIGTITPDASYKLHVNGNILGGNITMFGSAPTLSTNNGGVYNKLTLKGSVSNSSTSVSIDGATVGGGKLDVGTVDPPYTINGKKYATYLPSMTGVKEETTGKVSMKEKNDRANAYIRIIDFKNQPEGSDLWIFAKTTTIKDHMQDLTVLLSSNTNGKTWYTIDENNAILTLYSSTPAEVSFRFTAPRFDASQWKNRRDDSDMAAGLVINDDGNITSTSPQSTATAPTLTQKDTMYSLVGTFVEEFTSANKALYAQLTTGILHAQKMVSPLAEVETLTVSKNITSPVIETNEIKSQGTNLTVDLQSNNKGSLASVVINGLDNTPVATIDAEGNATFAGTLIAKNVRSDNISSLEDRINAIASSSATPRNDNLMEQINSIQTELGALKDHPLPNPAYYQNIDASYGNITVEDTANIYKARIADSLVVGTLIVEPDSILALTNDLYISSLGTIHLFDNAVVIANNGDMMIKGEVSLSSLAVKNKEGVTVASIDASGSAKFNEVVVKKFTLENIATQGALITNSGIMDATNTPIPAIKTDLEVAGTGTLPQDAKEIIIYNNNVTDTSLIYLTSTTDNMQGQLSVSKKVSCPIDLNCTPYFVVSSTNGIHSPSSFNWLIIN